MSTENKTKSIIVIGCVYLFSFTTLFRTFQVFPCTIWGWAMTFLGITLYLLILKTLYKFGDRIVDKVDKKRSKKELNELRDISVVRILILIPLMLIFVVAIPLATVLAIISYGLGDFIKSTPENPVLWTGMKGVSAKGRWNMI